MFASWMIPLSVCEVLRADGHTGIKIEYSLAAVWLLFL
jgi:hypothetical protein